MAEVAKSVVCTWPPERDEAEFARIAEEQRDAVTMKAQWMKAKWGNA